jgi:hypothetical protein
MTQAELECFQQVGMAVVQLSAEQRAKIESLASMAVIGGWSDIYHTQEERDAHGPANQLTGAAGEAAFFVWAESLGSGGFSAWAEAHQNRYTAKRGDGGVDCVLASGTEVDVKSSAIAQLSCGKALTMHLRSPGRVIGSVAYVQALLELEDMRAPEHVVLAGWVWGQNLLDGFAHHGFAGPVIKCRDTFGMGRLQ